jgi:hypothetical protein
MDATQPTMDQDDEDAISETSSLGSQEGDWDDYGSTIVLPSEPFEIRDSIQDYDLRMDTYKRFREVDCPDPNDDTETWIPGIVYLLTETEIEQWDSGPMPQTSFSVFGTRKSARLGLRRLIVSQWFQCGHRTFADANFHLPEFRMESWKALFRIDKKGCIHLRSDPDVAALSDDQMDAMFKQTFLADWDYSGWEFSLEMMEVQV